MPFPFIPNRWRRRVQAEPASFTIGSSPLRRLIGQATGGDYRSVESLIAAQAATSVWAVLEGDDGGTIYAAFPATMVACTEDTLRVLLLDVDALIWRDESMVVLAFEHYDEGAGIAGGMGGGFALAEGWVHPELVARGLEDAIRRVIRGESPALAG